MSFPAFFLRFLIVPCLAVLAAAEVSSLSAAAATIASEPAEAGYDIHAELGKNPGRPVYVPAGDHAIAEEIVLTADHSGLYGPGRIVMSDASRPIVVVRGAKGVTIKDVTLTRPEGRMDSTQAGLLLENATDTTVEGVGIVDNRSPAGAIRVYKCRHTRIINCSILNYMTRTVDDRTDSPAWGYAFNVVDGTGILVSESVGNLISGNSIIEKNFVPTKEVRDRYQLGKVVKRAPQRGSLLSEDAWNSDYRPNWTQGSGIAVTSPWITRFTRITDNYIENPAQGIDIHTDHGIVTGNMIINPSAIGMKACHGSRNLVISGNQITRACIIGIAISPAAASGPPMPATKNEKERPANTDGGHILANNIITDFGHGDAWWLWEGSTVLPVGPTPISIGVGQLPDDPPLRDVVVTGNVVYDPGLDGELRDGAIVYPKPRYNYAVFFQDKDVESQNGTLRAPVNVRFSGNMLQPGRQGVSNVPLPQ